MEICRQKSKPYLKKTKPIIFLSIFQTILTFVLILNFHTTAFADYSWEGLPPGYGLAWSDEFNRTAGMSPSTTYWNFETGTNGGWGNNELENYTSLTTNAVIIDDPNAVDGKALAIIALDPGGNNDQRGSYTSARLNTKTKGEIGPNAYFVARIRLPYGQGMWPAFWMLGHDNETGTGWPSCGEIDTMEYLGNNLNTAYGTIHAENLSGTGEVSTTGSGFTLAGSQVYHTEYHTFAAMLLTNQIQFFVDGNLYETYTSANLGGAWPFNQKQFTIINLAVGGTWPGNPDGSTSFPQTMLFDYVRAYQQGSHPDPAGTNHLAGELRR